MTNRDRFEYNKPSHYYFHYSIEPSLYFNTQMDLTYTAYVAVTAREIKKKQDAVMEKEKNKTEKI